MRRIALTGCVATLALLAGRAEAGIWQKVYSGLGWIATPSGSPIQTLSDGTKVNGGRSGRLRIVPDGIGPGYQLQMERTFGPGTRGRPETFQFGGVGELTLQGNMQMTASYFGKEFRTVDFSNVINNMAYDFQTNLGVEDYHLVGAFNAESAIQINPLGFYEVRMVASNINSQLILDGVLVRDEEDLDFAIGPITVKGNIFYDAAVAVLNAVGVDTTEMEELFPASPINTINEAIDSQLQSLDALTGGSIQADLNSLFAQAMLGGDATAAEDLLEALAADVETSDSSLSSPVLTPEPGTLLLVGAGAALTLRRYFR